jgi:hypothetical protein
MLAVIPLNVVLTILFVIYCILLSHKIFENVRRIGQVLIVFSLAPLKCCINRYTAVAAYSPKFGQGTVWVSYPAQCIECLVTYVGANAVIFPTEPLQNAQSLIQHAAGKKVVEFS